MTFGRRVLLFLALQIAFAPFAQLNHNTSSRFAAMASFCSEGSFEISRRITWTDDWARTPDGRVFSNKAPGGILVGTPLFCAIDGVRRLLGGERNGEGEILGQWRLRYIANLILALVFQLLPWLGILRLCDAYLEKRGASRQARDFAELALLFGTTAAIQLDVWLGHGLVAIFSMTALISLLEERPGWLGFSLGMLVLTEYSSALLIPVVILARPRLLRQAGHVAAGALVPAAAWIAYHVACFGGPFTIADRFQNPQFQDVRGSIQLWGVLRLPSPVIFLRLLFGWERGLLFSQPWVLIAAVAALRSGREDEATRSTILYSVGALVVLLVFNASFGGWHGGATTGPRYLTAALPPFALVVALGWEKLSAMMRRFLQAGLVFSFVVFALGKIIGATVGLWPEFLEQLGQRPEELAWKTLGFVLILVAARKLTPPRIARASGSLLYTCSPEGPHEKKRFHS